MSKRTRQAAKWDGEFGRRYTERNPQSVAELDQLRRERQFGVTQTALFERLLGDLDRDVRILEVGSNVGVQLQCLAELGFENLYGIDIQAYAVRQCHEQFPELNVVEGDALDIPFKDEFFDLVFTSGTLIMIPPERIETALDEVVRCSRRYVLGQEPYAEQYTEVTYRGVEEMFWKTDFAEKYLERHDADLRRSEFLEYKTNDNVDRLFLLDLQGAE